MLGFSALELSRSSAGPRAARQDPSPRLAPKNSGCTDHGVSGSEPCRRPPSRLGIPSSNPGELSPRNRVRSTNLTLGGATMTCPSCAGEQPFLRYEFGPRNCTSCGSSIVVQSSGWKWAWRVALIGGLLAWRLTSDASLPHTEMFFLVYLVGVIVVDRYTGHLAVRTGTGRSRR
jgi:hypothetical protein